MQGILYMYKWSFNGILDIYIKIVKIIFRILLFFIFNEVMITFSASWLRSGELCLLTLIISRWAFPFNILASVYYINYMRRPVLFGRLETKNVEIKGMIQIHRKSSKFPKSWTFEIQILKLAGCLQRLIISYLNG